jgi:hypothetical protein
MIVPRFTELIPGIMPNEMIVIRTNNVLESGGFSHSR